MLNAKQDIIGWLSLRIMGDCCQVREFGAASDGVVNSGDVLLILLGETLRRSPTSAWASSDGNVRLCLPTFVWNEIIESGCKSESNIGHFDEASVGDDDDMGWMYRIVNEDDDAAQSYLTRLFGAEDKENGSSCIEHLVWPTDSF
uniref:Uncharacterized protein n=1 Tax=Leptocylindrus danicus TaxID=163516 RepID=A0A7S2PCG4_9STRA